jgi:serine phosphatase RsbU (regulator of sigma subunit)
MFAADGMSKVAWTPRAISAALNVSNTTLNSLTPSHPPATKHLLSLKQNQRNSLTTLFPLSPPQKLFCRAAPPPNGGPLWRTVDAMPASHKPQPSSFELRVQQSEEARVGLFIGALLALIALITLRRLTGGVVMNSPVYWWTLALLGAGLLYESWVFYAAKRANAAARLLGEHRWRVNAAFDLGLAIGLLVILHILSPQGPVTALSAPALLLLPLVVLLSVLRLKPTWTLWTGLVGAAAHAVLVARTYVITQPDPSTLPALLSYAVLLLLTGVAGAMVAKRVRGYVEAAVLEGQSLLAAREEIGRVDRDLSMARGIQRGLLPQSTPEVPGFDIAGMSRAADHTGGDYYDWQKLPDGRLAVVLADVSGHGIAPALVMAVCRAYARASLPLMNDPAILLQQINTLVHDDVQGSRFVTLALAVVDGAASRLELISAGHGPGFLFRAATKEVEQFGGDGVPLGLIPDETYGPSRTIEMAQGDVLLMATDGFFEWQRTRDDQQFGITRLKDLLKNAGTEDAETILRRIDEAVLAFAEGAPQNDDVTAVVIKRK